MTADALQARAELLGNLQGRKRQTKWKKAVESGVEAYSVAGEEMKNAQKIKTPKEGQKQELGIMESKLDGL